MGTNGKYWDVSRNPVFGCTKCSPGCDNCWAEDMAYRLKCMGRPEYRDVVDKNGWTGLVKFDRSKLVKPIPGRGKVVFMGDMADVFHEELAFGEIDEILDFAIEQPQHKFLFCTKRADQLFKFYSERKLGLQIALEQGRSKHIFWGLTVCNQEEADEKMPTFLQIPGYKWLSIEPCLGGIDLAPTFNLLLKGERKVNSLGHEYHMPIRGYELLNGIILGGESGPGPMHPDWARSVRDQCAAAGVSFYFKQWNPLKVKHRLLDGREHNELPWRPK